jgi:hypothetical protein
MLVNILLIIIIIFLFVNHYTNGKIMKKILKLLHIDNNNLSFFIKSIVNKNFNKKILLDSENDIIKLDVKNNQNIINFLYETLNNNKYNYRFNNIDFDYLYYHNNTYGKEIIPFRLKTIINYNDINLGSYLFNVHIFIHNNGNYSILSFKLINKIENQELINNNNDNQDMDLIPDNLQLTEESTYTDYTDYTETPIF